MTVRSGKRNYLKKMIFIILCSNSFVYAEESSTILDLNKIAESLGLQTYDSLKGLLGQISFDGWLTKLTSQKTGVPGNGKFFSSSGIANILGQNVDIYLTTTKDPKVLGITALKGQQKALEEAANSGDLISIAFTLPKNFKFGTISTYFSFLDQLGLGGAAFVLSSEEYKDLQFGNIDKGLNLVGSIDFSSGVLSMINGWAKKMLNLSLDKGIHVQTVIPQNLDEMSLSLTIPESVTYPIVGVDSGTLPITVFDINLIINNKGLSGSAFIKPITLAGVTVSGKEADPGIMMNFIFDLWNLYEVSRLLFTFNTEDLAKLTQLTMNGKVSMIAPGIGGTISGPATVLLSKDGITADFKADIIKGFLDVEVQAKTDITHLDNWDVTGNFNQSTLNAFKNLMDEKAKEFLKEATKGIDDAKSKVDSAKRKVEELAAERKKIEQENLENIKKAQGQVQHEIDKLNELKRKLDDAKSRCG